MYFFKQVFFLVLIITLSLSCKAQESELWKDFEQASKKGTEPILPNFSYTGFRYSEVPIPTVDFPLFDVTDYDAIANDSKSDKESIKKAIKAATKNGNSWNL